MEERRRDAFWRCSQRLWALRYSRMHKHATANKRALREAANKLDSPFWSDATVQELLTDDSEACETRSPVCSRERDQEGFSEDLLIEEQLPAVERVQDGACDVEEKRQTEENWSQWCAVQKALRELDAKSERVEQERTEIAHLRAALDDERRDVATQRNALENRRIEAKHLIEEIEGAQATLKRWRKKNQKAASDYLSCQTALKDSEGEVEKKKAQIAELQKTANIYQNEAERWALEFQLCHGYNSWYVTAPIFCPYCIHVNYLINHGPKPRLVAVEYERRRRAQTELLDLFQLGYRTASSVKSYWKERREKKPDLLETKRLARMELSAVRRKGPDMI